MLAADMGSGLAAILADRIGERAPRLDADGVVAPVDVEGDIDLAGHARFSIAARNAARIFRGVAGISSISTSNGVERVVDGVEHGRRRADRAAFADALRLGDGGVAVGFHVMQLDLGISREVGGR